MKLMTRYGAFRGHTRVRQAAVLLLRQMGAGGYNYFVWIGAKNWRFWNGAPIPRAMAIDYSMDPKS